MPYDRTREGISAKVQAQLDGRPAWDPASIERGDELIHVGFWNGFVRGGL